MVRNSSSKKIRPVLWQQLVCSVATLTFAELVLNSTTASSDRRSCPLQMISLLSLQLNITRDVKDVCLANVTD